MGLIWGASFMFIKVALTGVAFTHGRLKLHRRPRGRVDPEEVVAPST